MEMPIEDAMLFRYSCKDMGLDCPVVIKSETLEEVTKNALVHVREVHADSFNHIQTPEEISRMEQSLKRSARVVVE